MKNKTKFRIDWRFGLKLILTGIALTVIAGIFGDKGIKTIYAVGLVAFAIYCVFSFSSLKKRNKEIRRIEDELNSLTPPSDQPSKIRRNSSGAANAWFRHLLFIGAAAVLVLILPKREDLGLLLLGTCLIAISATGISYGNIVAGPKGFRKIVDRNESPKAFWGFTTFYLAFGLVMVGLAAWKFMGT